MRGVYCSGRQPKVAVKYIHYIILKEANGLREDTVGSRISEH
jgi:hypothetical protein